MSSNLEMKPVQDRGECGEAEKGRAELLVARADPTAALDGGEKFSTTWRWA